MCNVELYKTRSRILKFSLMFPCKSAAGLRATLWLYCGGVHLIYVCHSHWVCLVFGTPPPKSGWISRSEEEDLDHSWNLGRRQTQTCVSHRKTAVVRLLHDSGETTERGRGRERETERKIRGSCTVCRLKKEKKRDFTHNLSLRSRHGESHTCSRPEKGLCLIERYSKRLISSFSLDALITRANLCVHVWVSQWHKIRQKTREDFTEKHETFSVWLVHGNRVEHCDHTPRAGSSLKVGKKKIYTLKYRDI